MLNHNHVMQNGILEPLAPKYRVLWEGYTFCHWKYLSEAFETHIRGI